MRRSLRATLATIFVAMALPSLALGQITLNEGIDTTLPEAGLNGPDLEHGGFDQNGNEDPFFNHPEADNARFEWDLNDSTNLDGEPGKNYSLVWFDIPQNIISNFGPNSFAVLRMTTVDDGDAADMHRMTSDWLSDDGGGGNLVTFENIADGPGVVPGQNATADPSVQWPSSTVGTVDQVDVSADLLAWAGGEPNYGWGFVPTGGNGHAIASFETVDFEKPTLTIGSKIATIINRTQPPNTNTGHVWKYFDLLEEDVPSYPNGWNELNFNDDFWSSGPAILGNGGLRGSDDTGGADIEEVPDLGAGDLPFGTIIASSASSANPRRRRETDLFRSKFNLTAEAVAAAGGVGFEILAEDGAVIYINGQEVARTGVTDDPVNANSRARARSGSLESTYEDVFGIFGRTNPLREGENVLAVELHQDRDTSNDRGFDLAFSLIADPGTPTIDLGPTGPELQAGDADQDLDFDQLDLVKVQIANKYLTGNAATWGEGDWNGAPGGSPGSPPAGNGLFDQLDIIAASLNGLYLTGPYGAVADGGVAGDGQTSVSYNPGTGEVAVDAPAGTELTSINIDSASGIFTGDAAANLGGSFDNDADGNIFKATFGGSFGSVSFGNVAQTGLAKDVVLNDLTVVGSLAGGGALGDVDLIYVPEPSTMAMLLVGFAGLLGLARRRS